MDIMFSKLFAKLLFWLYEMLDTIFEMFQVLSGVQGIEGTNGESARSLIEIFLQSSAVTKAFFILVLLSIFVAAVSICVAVVKNIVNLKGGERKSHATVVGQGFGAIVITFVMALMMFLGIGASNVLLKEVSKATSPSEGITIATTLFDISVGKIYKIDYANGTPRPSILKDANGYPILDENGNTIMTELRDSYGNIVYDYPPLLDEDGNQIYETGWTDKDNGRKLLNDKVKQQGWSSLDVDEIFGVRQKDLFVFENKSYGYSDGKEPMVELQSFNMFVAYLVVCIMLVAIIWSMLSLVKRIYDLVLLFIALPLVSATIPLDDGARFKQWRDSVISKVVLAYGVVFSINVFLLITPLLNDINFASLGWSAFLENLFKAFMLIGGALSINGGQLLFARLLGTSAEESREMAHSARALMMGMATAGGLAKGAKNVVFGGTNKYGKRREGIIPWGSRQGYKIGSKVGGEKFENSRTGKVMGGLGKVNRPNQTMNALSGNNAAKEGNNAVANNVDNNDSNDSNTAYTPQDSNNVATQSSKPHEGLIKDIIPKNNESNSDSGAFKKGD